MVKVFYHNDPDGWCSAYWVRKHLEEEGIPFASEDFIEMNYDRPFPWNVLQPNEQVFMVDFSLDDPEDMRQLALQTNLTWIDHHISAIVKMGKYCKIPGFRQDGVAACALTWIWNTYGNIKEESLSSGLPSFENLIKDAPLFTRYIHLWDTWKWKDHPEKDEIEAFIVSINSIPNPLSKSWDLLFLDQEILHGENYSFRMAKMIDAGYSKLQFRDDYAKGMCQSTGKVIEFEGYRCFVCNMPKCNSEWFKSVDPSTYDIMMPFYYNMQTNQFCVSLYSDKVDVSKIAVKWSGGGHRGAAGFQSRNLPWLLDNRLC
jgi:oligoribonuclease NrnB/cAMP/cGMP phosphodiesterase (DHH superfamily)